MIKIGIIDDQPNWLTVINDKLKTHYQGLSLFLYRSVKEIDRDLDFILLDIDMPDVDGIEFSKRILILKLFLLLIMIHELKKLFGPNVYGYISKSNLENELYNKVDEMITLIKDNYTVSFNVHGQETLVRINDIIYCQFLGDELFRLFIKIKV
ncbi:hypothetical protein SD457_25670 [Coprobacillaceae bacterium CR2/5/TPMF4]|nr:hypothetical protein SD457_25670 [Coprobacillaceae bacterium CR2/5/TPMF4]